MEDNKKYNTKKCVIGTLLQCLDDAGGIRYVSEPQSPFVMDNPDVLAVADNSIFGVFIPSIHEKKNIDSFLRRIYTSRLVYARDMKTILLFDVESEGDVNKWPKSLLANWQIKFMRHVMLTILLCYKTNGKST